jgi:hypothetical protein
VVRGQELDLTGSGTAGSWTTLSSYGTGNRPRIIRSSSESDRAIRLTNPDYWSIGATP